jgi:hypothetical protein
MLRTLALICLACACSTDAAPAPSCADATAHYYAAGCAYRSAGVVQSADEVRSTCVGMYAQEPASCTAKIDAWTECMASVPDTATTADECDCSVELQAAAVCQ